MCSLDNFICVRGAACKNKERGDVEEIALEL